MKISEEAKGLLRTLDAIYGDCNSVLFGINIDDHKEAIETIIQHTLNENKKIKKEK